MRLPPALILLAALSAQAVAADPPAVDPAAFEVTVDQITLTRSIAFADSDLARGTSTDQATVQLRLTFGSVQLADFGEISFDSVLTDAREELALPQQDDHGSFRMLLRNYRQLATMPGQKPYVPLQLQIRYPSKPARALAKLKGTIEVVCEIAPGEIIDLTPASDWVGKKRDIPGSEVGFTLIALAPLQYVCDQAITEERLVKSLTFLDEHGKEVRSGGWSGSGDGKRTTVTRNGANLDAKGTIRLALLGKTAKVLVPVDLTDVPLVAPPRPVVAPHAPVAPVAPAAPEAPAKTGKNTDF